MSTRQTTFFRGTPPSSRPSISLVRAVIQSNLHYTINPIEVLDKAFFNSIDSHLLRKISKQLGSSAGRCR